MSGRSDSAHCRAIGFIGDRRAVAMLQRDELRTLPRAFAAVALGLVGDTRELPWNAVIAANNNYFASVETLNGDTTGILDIL